MPARLRKTYPTTNTGYFHREHRSKKGRRRFNDDKSANYYQKIKKDEKRIGSHIQKKIVVDLDKVLAADPLKMSVVYRRTTKTAKKQTNYPKLVCENCGVMLQLHFDPTKNGGEILLHDVICDKCGLKAYYANYYGFKFVWTFYSAAFVFLRDLIKQRKAKLQDFWI